MIARDAKDVLSGIGEGPHDADRFLQTLVPEKIDPTKIDHLVTFSGANAD
jgi:hypothetical protein